MVDTSVDLVFIAVWHVSKLGNSNDLVWKSQKDSCSKVRKFLFYWYSHQKTAY